MDLKWVNQLFWQKCNIKILTLSSQEVINPLLSTQRSLLIPLKTSEKQRLKDVFRVIEREHWEEKG